MSRRNPQNERYLEDNRSGVTRKSAASAKPKSRAAASVNQRPKEKTKQEKKLEARALRKKEEEKQREIARKYDKCDTPRYKRYKIAWWVTLILAVVCAASSFFIYGNVPDGVALAVQIAAYVLLAAAFIIDIWKVRGERKRWREEMLEAERRKDREAKAAKREKGKQATRKGSGKNQNRHAAAAAQKKAQEEAAAEEQPKKGLLGGLFGKKDSDKMWDAKKKA